MFWIKHSQYYVFCYVLDQVSHNITVFCYVWIKYLTYYCFCCILDQISSHNISVFCYVLDQISHNITVFLAVFGSNYLTILLFFLLCFGSNISQYYLFLLCFGSNISQYYCFCCVLDQINAGLVSRRDIKTLTVHELLMVVYYDLVIMCLQCCLAHISELTRLSARDDEVLI